MESLDETDAGKDEKCDSYDYEWSIHTKDKRKHTE